MHDLFSHRGNDEWSFEEEIVNFGCEVYTFDPSLKMGPHLHKPSIWFYPFGISHFNEDNRQLENVKGELLYLTKKETADCELCHNVARTEKTEEQNNNRFTVMAHCGQKRRADKQRNSRLSDMPQRGQERKVEETEEQRNSRLVRQDVSRDLRE
ncbi:hypothetical protein AVEN_199703-1 [Araneus ventricosus]|uniref:Uncharacterized protein n=1 Tax=Araneus ventricosus TaxID=182803 RepID=A0A4Y2H0E2_ARAVE|nr:hypothetical protein AVEN_199703-1 [Araneus ventricosus]